ncbi:hypothetical protein KJ673_03595 [Patescibacteria group bacterium]|nr:hypothetical protein [Patescibacteria group bacterium]MCG2687501.1 hypothetical protein [Candidatus Parcubacteria bacterium]
MKICKIIIPLCVLSLFVSGCGSTDAVRGVTDNGYRKVSMTIDVVVKNDGSVDGGVCFGNGTIATVLYFPYEGGEPVAQTSTLTVHSVPCIDCYSEITDAVTAFPIELSAVLEPSSVEINDADGNPLSMKDELRFWINTPPIHSLNIYYECGGAPDTLPDYGSAVSQIASPIVLTQWTQDLALNVVKRSTFNDYAFPPSFLADVTFSSIETLVNNINE